MLSCRARQNDVFFSVCLNAWIYRSLLFTSVFFVFGVKVYIYEMKV